MNLTEEQLSEIQIKVSEATSDAFRKTILDFVKDYNKSKKLSTVNLCQNIEHYDIEKKKISIQKILTSKEIVEFESVKANKNGEPNCYISKEKKNNYDNNR